MSKKGVSHKKITNFDDLVLALWLVLVLSLLKELSVNFSFYNLPRTTLACYGCSDGVKWQETAERGKKKWLISLEVCHGYSNVLKETSAINWNLLYLELFQAINLMPGYVLLIAISHIYQLVTTLDRARSRTIAQDVQTSVWKKTEKLDHKQTINYKK